jgi:hypothetical protein
LAHFGRFVAWDCEYAVPHGHMYLQSRIHFRKRLSIPNLFVPMHAKGVCGKRAFDGVDRPESGGISRTDGWVLALGGLCGSLTRITD